MYDVQLAGFGCRPSVLGHWIFVAVVVLATPVVASSGVPAVVLATSVVPSLTVADIVVAASVVASWVVADRVLVTPDVYSMVVNADDKTITNDSLLLCY